MSTKLEQAYLNLEKIADVDYSYCDPKKKTLLHSRGKRFLRLLVEHLDLQGAKISSNKAGIAVSGEITMISPTLYIQISEHLGNGLSLLIRGTRSDYHPDYTGLNNHIVKVRKGLDTVLAVCDRAMKESQRWTETHAKNTA